MPASQEVLQQMQALIDEWRAARDARAIFLRCYQLMTANMLGAVQAGQFHDPPWVSRLLHHFATYYFSALDQYDQAAPDTPAVWLFAFERTFATDQSPLQKLMLGVNAHINYDLVLTLLDMLQPEWDRLSPTERGRRYEDHCQINAIISATIDGVQDQIIEPTSRGLAIADTALGPFDEWLTAQLIAHWREEVWRNTMDLLGQADRQERAKRVLAVERGTLERATAIALQNGYLPMRHLF